MGEWKAGRQAPEAHRQGGEAGRPDGKQAGRKEGREEGSREGWMDGWKEGRKEGERTIPLTIQPTSSLELRSVLFSSIVPSMPGVTYQQSCVKNKI